MARKPGIYFRVGYYHVMLRATAGKVFFSAWKLEVRSKGFCPLYCRKWFTWNLSLLYVYEMKTVINKVNQCVRYLLFFLLLFPAIITAATQQEIKHIIQQGSAPLGIVFEILEHKESDITWTLEIIKQASQKLRLRFPSIKIAVVSHGNELFALTKARQSAYIKVHRLVKQLNKNNIPVEVCGSAASWQNKAVKDFPEYVDVVEAAPDKIQFYEDLGYRLIEVAK